MILKAVAVALFGLALAGAAYVRLAPFDPAIWHVDPAQAQRTGRPNDYLIALGGDQPPVESMQSPADLAELIRADLAAQPGVTLLAATPERGLFTYVQRSRLIGFPDVLSFRVTPDGDGSHLVVWSRARFGQSDLGVNRRHVEAMLARTGLAG